MKRLFLALAVGLVAAPALALPPLGATIGYSADVVSHRSYDFVAAIDDLPRFVLTAGTRFHLDHGTVDLDLAFSFGGYSGTAHQTLGTELMLVALEVAGTYRYPWMRHLEPTLRLSAGPSWATLTAYTAGGSVHQTVPNLSATGLLGLSVPFLLSRDRGLELVFDLGVGYSLRPVFAFDALQRDPPEHPTGDEVRDVPLSLGELNLSGMAYRFSVGLRF